MRRKVQSVDARESTEKMVDAAEGHRPPGGNRLVAANALGVQRAVVAGQIIPGVPVWRLGEDSRFPGMSYIVFPGNVGTETSMTAVVQALRTGA